MTRLLALDIGGANLKAADGRGLSVTRYFPLWQRPHDLAAALVELLNAAPHAERIVATMTGELVDAFRTKAEGVRSIVDALEAASGPRQVSIYLTDGSLVSPDVAKECPLLAAASNWHAIARFAARWVETEAGLLVDIGSTTCDIIPIVAGQPASRGRTDPERLATGELIYTGVERSPICAVAAKLPWRGNECRTAHELFATTWDAYLVTGDLPEEPESSHTADGRPATRQHARDRLARAICADATMFDDADAQRVAEAIAAAQCDLLFDGLREVIQSMRPSIETVVVSGRGDFLARRAVERLLNDANVVSLSKHLGTELSRVAPAHALAVLAMEAGM